MGGNSLQGVVAAATTMVVAVVDTLGDKLCHGNVTVFSRLHLILILAATATTFFSVSSKCP